MANKHCSVWVAGTLACALTLGAAPAQAQSSLGVVGGFNVADLKFDPPISRVYDEGSGLDASSSGVNGLAAGVSFERPLAGRPRLRIEGLFSRAGTTIEGAGMVNGVDYAFKQQITLSMLEVPVLAVLPVGTSDRVRLMAGAFLAFNLSQKDTLRDTLGGELRDIELEGDERAQIRNPHAGLALGAEVSLTPRMGVGGRFNLGLTNLDDEDDFDSIKLRIVRLYVVIKLK